MKRENVILWVAFFLLFGVWIGSKFGEAPPAGGKMSQFFDYLKEEYVEELDMDSLQAEAMDHILSSLDPHSTYIPLDEGAAMAERMQGGFSGIGVEFAIKKDTLVFVHVMRPGPADASGILSGDRVYAIDKDTIVGESLTNDIVTSKIKGRRGTSVSLEVIRGKEQLSFEVQRDLVPIESVLHLPVEDGVGYLKIDRFAETTHDEFVAHLDYLSATGMEELIIDLRDNPGGYLHESVAMADEFLGDNKNIVTTKYKDGSTNTSKAKSGNRFEELPVHILINENSASASEVFTGALQDHDRATVYGRTSFGKGLVQEDKVLADGSKVRLTVAYYYTPSGRSIQKPYREGQVVNEGVFISDTGRVLYSQGGIEPDIEIANDSASYFWTFSYGTIDAFGFDYADSRRGNFKDLNFSNFYSDFTITEDILSSFLEFGAYGIELEDLGAFDRKELSILLKAGIARNLWGFDAYRKVLLKDDASIAQIRSRILG
ncbi:MAG: S41 family peptidase [Schleiferiaceae bacterium]